MEAEVIQRGQHPVTSSLHSTLARHFNIKVIDSPNNFNLESRYSTVSALPRPRVMSTTLAVRPVSSDRSDSIMAAMARSRVDLRSQLLQSALLLFATHGFGGTTLQDIATEVGCSKASLLCHFGSKEAIFTELLTPTSTAATGTHRAPDRRPRRLGCRRRCSGLRRPGAAVPARDGATPDGSRGDRWQPRAQVFAPRGRATARCCSRTVEPAPRPPARLDVARRSGGGRHDRTGHATFPVTRRTVRRRATAR